MTATAISNPSAPSLGADRPIVVERWPSERPLFALAVVVSLGFWLVATVTVVGLVYALCFALFFFVLQMAFVAHVRGNGVRLGPEQFPDLYERVQRLAWRMGIARPPEVYLMQAGGSLNAFATRFLRTHVVVLYSDLLEACGDDDGARDMIIAHELGHVRAGHLRDLWLTVPAGLVPFLGAALSRAREYTCDRYGLAGAGNRESATFGLTILAAGASHARQVNRSALVRQTDALNTGFMTLGEWLASHPPLSRRIAQLDPSLGPAAPRTTGRTRALAIIIAALAPLVIASWFAASRLPGILADAERAAQQQQQAGDEFSPLETETPGADAP